MHSLVWIMLFVTIISLSGMALGFADGRRKHKVELRAEERRLVEAKTKELEAQNKRIELEYQQAALELERFDRRSGPGSGATTAPSAARSQAVDHETPGS